MFTRCLAKMIDRLIFESYFAFKKIIMKAGFRANGFYLQQVSIDLIRYEKYNLTYRKLEK